MWLIAGAVAFITVIFNLILVSHNRYKYCVVLICISLSSGLIAMLSEYILINSWVKAKDISALMDVVPTMSNVLVGVVLIGIMLNAIVVFMHYKKTSK